MLAVASERRVRGATERTYILRLAAANIGIRELREMTLDDHRQAFMAFVAGLLSDFDRYLERGTPDFLRDGVSYSLAGFWLDDDELRDASIEVSAALEPYLANGPRPGRTRRLFATVLMPAE